MRTQSTAVQALVPDEKWLYRAGGLSGILLGVAYLAIIVLYIPLGAPPTGAEARLAYTAGSPAAWWAILGLSVLTDFLFVPLAFGLYLALRGVNRSAMLLATAFVGLFVVLDLAVTWTNYAALIALGGQYAAATGAQRAALITAAAYPTAVLESGLLFVYNTLTLAIGILISGWVMLKGAFSRAAAYVGLATGVVGLIAVAGPYLVSALSVTIIFASLLTMIWTVLAGIDLYRLGR